MDRARLEEALRNADAAGDVQAARQLAAALRGMETAPAEAPKKEPYQPTILPLRRGESGEIEFAVPQIAKELWQGVRNPGDILAGRIDPTMENLTRAGIQTSGAVTTGGIATPRVMIPAFSMTMNAAGPTVRRAAQAGAQTVETIAQPLRSRMNPQEAIARTLLRRIRDQNPGMSDEEALTATRLQLRRLGSDAMLADTGESMARLGRNVAQAPGQTATIAKQALQQRRAGEKTAMIGSIERNISGRGYYDALAKARKARAKSGPLFQEAYEAFPNVSNDKLRLMVEQDPAIRQAMNKGLALERAAATEAGERFEPESFGVITQFNEAGDPIITEMQQTPLKLWHATKRGLDALISRRKNALGKIDRTDPETASLIGLRSSLDRELKRATGGDEGAYARANKIASDSYRLEEALDSGRAFARGDEEVTARMFKALSNAEQDAYRAGVAREMVAMIRRNTSDLTPAQIMSIVKNEAGVRKKLEIIAPSKRQLDRLMKDIETRLKFRETERTAMNVSQTGSILMEEGAIASDALQSAGRAAAIVTDIGRGNLPAAFGKTLQLGVEQLRRLPMGQEARDRIGRLLYSTDKADQQEALRLIRTQIRTKTPAGR